MSRRWQTDGIPLWRKLFSSNWWWYGEANPDPASLPAPEKRPKFWRGDVFFLATLSVFGPLSGMFFVEVNDPRWGLLELSHYEGRISSTSYRQPQLNVQLKSGEKREMAFPTTFYFGMQKPRPIYHWMSLVDDLDRYKIECPGQQLLFEASVIHLVFYRYLGVWEVRCAAGGRVIISRQKILEIWDANNKVANFGMLALFLS
jgi:hypothetical protein